MDQFELLHFNASQCRHLADTAITTDARDILLNLAHDYDERAATLRATDTKSLHLLKPAVLQASAMGR